MELDLTIAFNKRVKTFADFRQLKVQWPDVDFNAKDLDAHLSVAILPIPPAVIGVCNGSAIHRWICQINVHSIDGIGDLKAKATIDDLKLSFPVNSLLEGTEHKFKVITPPSPVPEIRKKGWFYIPVQFRCQVIS